MYVELWNSKRGNEAANMDGLGHSSQFGLSWLCSDRDDCRCKLRV